MPRNPHFYLHTFLRALVTATTDEALNTPTDALPHQVVDRLIDALAELGGILNDIADHLEAEEPSDDLQQELNYYAGLEL